jgi:hypothetical protein
MGCVSRPPRDCKSFPCLLNHFMHVFRSLQRRKPASSPYWKTTADPIACRLQTMLFLNCSAMNRDVIAGGCSSPWFPRERKLRKLSLPMAGKTLISIGNGINMARRKTSPCCRDRNSMWDHPKAGIRKRFCNSSSIHCFRNPQWLALPFDADGVAVIFVR